MANVIPFNGILYNVDNIGKMVDVVAPPYDVISSKEQEELYNRHKHNIIRLILGKKYPNDNEVNNPHIRAANYFNEWKKNNIFFTDKESCFYLEASEFEMNGKILTRLGLIARTKIEPFEKRIIMPHEKTFSKVKSERLGLIKASKMNFSCIFALYPDKFNIFKQLNDIVINEKPWTDFLNYDGLRHRLWRIENKDFQSHITKSLSSERFIIADGHHRYETALNYKKYLAEHDNSFDKNHPANYVMMYLSSMEDPGLIIKPTHRMIKNMSSSSLNDFINKSSEFFNIADYEDKYDKMLKDLNVCQTNTFGFSTELSKKNFIFVLKDNVMKSRYADELPISLSELDVSVLTRLVFMDILNLDQKKMDDTSSLGFISDTNKAINSVKDGKYDAAFILNPTKIEQVKKVSEKGYIMPRKSTFFYPKVISGLVLNTLKID